MPTATAVAASLVENNMIDMQVKHWNYGEGVVIQEASCKEDAPLEWQHDWQSVVMVQFWHLNNACIWVLNADLDVSNVA